MQHLRAYAVHSGGRLIALRSRSPMVREDAAHVWMDVAFEGTWEGHPNGAFTFDRATFEQMIANFEANPNGAIPLDYEHATEWATEAPAAGWVQKLAIRDDDAGRAHLWAYVELTDKAAQQIKAGEYRFSSGVFDFEAIDLVTGDSIGAAMASLAMTNSPFIRGQEPYRLSQRAARRVALGGTVKISKEDLLAALEALDSDDISPEQLEAAFEFAVAKAGQAEPEAPMADEPEPPPAEDAPLADEPAEDVAAADGEPPAEEVPAAEGEMMPPAEGGADAVLAPLMDALGVDLAGLEAAMRDNMDAVVAALMGSAPAADAPLADVAASHALSARDNQIKALTSTVKTLSAWKAEREGKDADREVEVLVCSGRLLDSGRAFARKLYLSDRAGFDAFAASLPAVVPVGEHAAPASDTSTSALPPIEETPETKELRRVLKAAAKNARITLTDAEIDAAVRRRVGAMPARESRV